MYLNFIFVYMLMPIESVSFAPHELFLMHEPIRVSEVPFFPLPLPLTPSYQNNLFGYGQYCGAGPDESLWPLLQPIDEFDQACQRHDDDYRICYESLSEEIGFPIPKFVHQIVAMRGLLPINLWFFGSIHNYLTCMHEADQRFIKLLKHRYDHNQLPTWWRNLAKAPTKIEGIEGFEEACTVGISSLGFCAVSSKQFFQIVMRVFQLSVESDLPYLNFEPLAAVMV